jgi:HD superfamily phosphohydrolase YqeK
MILHQKISAAMAREIFSVTNPTILNAIGCHTTLKADASTLDKIVFAADKLKWDQEGNPPYLTAMTTAIGESIDAGALCYLEYLWQGREVLPVLHPWAVEAYRQLSEKSR